MAAEGVQRKLTTILAADVAGYSRLMAADEETTHRTLTAYRAIILDLLKKHQGRLVDTAGDSVLADFASAVEAVRCAISIQEELAVRNAELPEDRRMLFRIGINVGDVIVEGDDIFGDAVNVAARLESVATPGSVCISGSTFEQVKNKLSIGFTDIGLQDVKNIPHPVAAYQLTEVPLKPERSVSEPKPHRRVWLKAFVAAAVAVAGVGAYAVWSDDRAAERAEALKLKKEAAAIRQREEAVRRRLAEAERQVAAERERAAQEQKQRAEEEVRRRAAEAARRRAEAEARQKEIEEARRKAAEETRRQAEAEARRKAEAEARRRAEAEARRRAEEEARRKAEEEARQRAKAEAKRKAAEEAKKRAETEAHKKATAAARLKAQKAAQERARAAARCKAAELARRRAAAQRMQGQSVAVGDPPQTAINPGLLSGRQIRALFSGRTARFRRRHRFKPGYLTFLLSFEAGGGLQIKCFFQPDRNPAARFPCRADGQTTYWSVNNQIICWQIGPRRGCFTVAGRAGHYRLLPARAGGRPFLQGPFRILR
jgi:class 3 adenylate cyclase